MKASAAQHRTDIFSYKLAGKMAAIKSLGDKGLISADDRGHLKDLLLNNDSPQLQEALDHYNNTGDFQAVKAILVKELSNPSTKRNTGDWISETLINDITMNFVSTCFVLLLVCPVCGRHLLSLL